MDDSDRRGHQPWKQRKAPSHWVGRDRWYQHSYFGPEYFGLTSIEGLSFAVSEETSSTVFPDLRAGSQITTPPDILGQPSSTYTSQAYWYTVEVPRDWTIDHSDDFTQAGKSTSRVVMWHPKQSADSSMEVQISLETVGTSNYQTLSSVVATLQPVTLPGWEDFAVVAIEPIGNGFIRTSRAMQAYRYNYRYGPPQLPDQDRRGLVPPGPLSRQDIGNPRIRHLGRRPVFGTP